uniref:Uncharacterized protein n=1 Tax=Anguilla anguilla TaxID=7936 RepID=A0A0E9QSU9_ANGAN
MFYMAKLPQTNMLCVLTKSQARKVIAITKNEIKCNRMNIFEIWFGVLFIIHCRMT